MRSTHVIDTSRPDDAYPVIAPRPNLYDGLSNFVSSAQTAPVHLPPTVLTHNTVMDVPVNSAEVVHVHTTELDRSRGYLWRTIPLSVAFAIGITLLATVLQEEPFLSWGGFVIFWLAFVGAWMYGESRYGRASPNAAALEEIKRKWDNIDANDARRWDAWEKATGISVPVVQSWVEQYKWVVILWGIVSSAWMLAITLILLEG